MIKTEHWKSNKGGREDHYFKGREYLFGYNPKFVNKKKLKQILKIINIKELDKLQTHVS